MATLATGKQSEMLEDFLKSTADRSGDYVYRTRISQLISSEGKSLVVDFGDLLRYNNDLANKIMLEPDSSLEAFKRAAYETMRSENAVYADRVRKELRVRVRGIPDQVPLRKVDTSYLDKMLAAAGMVVRTSELRPLMVEAAFVCPSGHLTYQEQDDMVMKKPPKCELCEESRNFELDKRHSRFIDFQIIRIQELPEELPPGQLPQFFDVNLEGDIVNMARPGDRVVITGLLRAVPDLSPGQVRTRLFRSQIECNYVEVKGKEPGQVQITKEDEALIKSIAASPNAYEKLFNSIAPAVMGRQAEKEAILLLLAGGAATVLPDGTKLRGDINVLLVGDPGVAKSELLKFTAQVAPRGIFASGRGTTAAGLSAAVIREKNVLMLEAGVVVLADQGIACIDEFDKMKAEDRTALHEQMEQQSYHPSNEILFSDGKKVKIGEFVESAFRAKGAKIIQGKDCEVALLGHPAKLYSADLSGGNIAKASVDRVSRHRAPESFVRIRYSNGRSVLVTPEHPVFVYREDGVATVKAEKLEVGDFAPAPRFIPNSSVPVQLTNQATTKQQKKITQPATLSLKTARILGYLITEGNFYEGSSVEVDFTNLEPRLLDEMRDLMRDEFQIEPTFRRSEGKDAGLRYVSKVLHAWLRLNFPEMVQKARRKRAPAKILGASVAHINEFLASAFLGDGSVETEAICYRTASSGLAEDYQDLLLKLGVASRIDVDRSNDSFKVYITGDSLERFFASVVHPLDPRFSSIRKLVKRSAKNNRKHDVLPTSVARLYISLLKRFGLPYNGEFQRHLSSRHGINVSVLAKRLEALEERRDRVLRMLENSACSLRELRREAGWSQQRLVDLTGVPRGAIDYAERGGYPEEERGKIVEKARTALRTEFESIETISYLKGLMKLRFLRVTAVERVGNTGPEKVYWVHDVTVEPSHNFISAGAILHNTVTIAKGGIYASLNARTAILAACNPVLGRYNPFQNLTENISTLPIPLLTRFDLIFVIKDQPSPAEDEKLASHILSVHARKAYTTPPPVEFSLLKKYLAYAKKGSPTLTKDAMDRLREYYLDLRKASTEGQIPPTPRTLEALIRISTARARLLLRDVVNDEDALAAIALMNKMVEDVLTDATTKKPDFGIQLGKPAGERRNLAAAITIFKTLEGAEKRPVERRAFKEELVKAKFNDEDAEKMIKTMFREGLIYESRPGFFRRVGA